MYSILILVVLLFPEAVSSGSGGTAAGALATDTGAPWIDTQGTYNKNFVKDIGSLVTNPKIKSSKFATLFEYIEPGPGADEEAKNRAAVFAKIVPYTGSGAAPTGNPNLWVVLGGFWCVKLEEFQRINPNFNWANPDSAANGSRAWPPTPKKAVSASFGTDDSMKWAVAVAISLFAVVLFYVFMKFNTKTNERYTQLLNEEV